MFETESWTHAACFHFAVKMWNFNFRLMEMFLKERKEKKISLHLKSYVDWGQTINDQILSKRFQATISFSNIGCQNCQCPTDPVVIHVQYAVRLSPADTTLLFCMILIWWKDSIRYTSASVSTHLNFFSSTFLHVSGLLVILHFNECVLTKCCIFHSLNLDSIPVWKEGQQFCMKE